MKEDAEHHSAHHSEWVPAFPDISHTHIPSPLAWLYVCVLSARSGSGGYSYFSPYKKHRHNVGASSYKKVVIQMGFSIGDFPLYIIPFFQLSGKWILCRADLWNRYTDAMPTPISSAMSSNHIRRMYLLKHTSVSLLVSSGLVIAS